MIRLNEFLDPARMGHQAASLAYDLKHKVIGQDHAIQKVVEVYQMYTAGLAHPGRPVGNFLFLGPTGTGKTRLVEAVAESLVKSANGVIKIDCAEFQHSHEIAKLIGSPPGYLGHRETHALLSQEVLDRYHTADVKLSFVLFDEIEKASDSLWSLLLGVLDKATLTLGDNRRVDFSRAMIFLTSNLGSEALGNLLRPKLGFATAAEAGDSLNAKIVKTGEEAARRKFTPEFINRLDQVIVFRSLDRSDLEQVLAIELNLLQHLILESTDAATFVFRVSRAARNLLLDEGTDARYGARHLKRVIDKRILHPLANLLASDQVSSGDMVEIDCDPGRKELVFIKTVTSMPAYVMADMAVEGSYSPYEEDIKKAA